MNGARRYEHSSASAIFFFIYLASTEIYTGSFDPLTNGHVAIIRAAAALCDRLVVAVGTHAGKQPMFSADERRALIEASCGALPGGCALEVATFAGLAVDAARAHGAGIIVRGLRGGEERAGRV